MAVTSPNRTSPTPAPFASVRRLNTVEGWAAVGMFVVAAVILASALA